MVHNFHKIATSKSSNEGNYELTHHYINKIRGPWSSKIRKTKDAKHLIKPFVPISRGESHRTNRPHFSSLEAMDHLPLVASITAATFVM